MTLLTILAQAQSGAFANYAPDAAAVIDTLANATAAIVTEPAATVQPGVATPETVTVAASTPLWLVLLCIIALAGVAYLFYQALTVQKVAAQKLEAYKAEREEMKAQIGELTAKVVVLNKKVNDMARAMETLKAKPAPKPAANEGFVFDAPAKGKAQAKAAAPAPEIKYCEFAYDDSSHEISVRDRDLSDSPEYYWFVVYINPDGTAEYTINPDRKADIMANLMLLKCFTKPFDAVSSPRDISVARRGSMRREGREWIVTDPLQITLK